jgi:Uma2 family endonuclease
MGTAATPEALTLRWIAILNDPALRSLPYKIELNAWGKIEMTPASNRHGRLQSLIAAELLRQLQDGIVVTEASILTDIGIRVPDVVWGSRQFAQAYGETTPYPRAPEICVEITSPANSDDEIREKIRAYLAAGAQEVWIAAEDGTIVYHDAAGQQSTSRFTVTIRLPGPIH